MFVIEYKVSGVIKKLHPVYDDPLNTILVILTLKMSYNTHPFAFVVWMQL